MKKINILIILLIITSTISCPHQQPGLSKASLNPSFQTAYGWSNVKAGENILLDFTPPPLYSLVIDGTLIIDNRDIALTVGYIKINPGGKLIMGSSSCPITRKVIITLTGQIGNNELGFDSSVGGFLGDRGIAVYSGATLEIFGALPLKTWTFLSKTASVNENILTTKDHTGWKGGDVVVITNTDYSPILDYSTQVDQSISWQKGKAFPDQTEVRTIQSVSLGVFVSINQPLKYNHFKGNWYAGEVALLNRNIVIQGGDNLLSKEYGGHIIIRKASSAIIQGVEFTKMGQKGLMGRYPVHFHLSGDTKGAVIRGCSFHNNFQRAMSIHDSNNVLIENNVAYNNFGHTYFLEDGSERRNSFINNIGINPRPVSSESGKQLTPSDSEPSVFWITNPNNNYIGNVAAGGKFGFWIALPKDPLGLSSRTYGTNHIEIRPRWTPLARFENNIAHSAFTSGLHVDDGPQPNGRTEGTTYTPLAGPYSPNVASYELNPVYAIFKGFVGYKNRGHGSWFNCGGCVMDNFLLVGNRVGHGGPTFGGQTIVQNSVIVGESDDLGLVVRPDIDAGGRSRPGVDGPTTINGLNSYDNAGPQYARNITFMHFFEFYYPVGALGILDEGPFLHDTRNIYSELKYVSCQRTRIVNSKSSNDGPFGVAILDSDGSTTGISGGGWIVSNNPLLYGNGNCISKPSENTYYCPTILESFVHLKIIDTNFRANSFTNSNGVRFDNLSPNYIANNLRRVTYTQIGTPFSFSYYGKSDSCGGDICETMSYPTILKSRKQFAVSWGGNIESPKNMKIRLSSDYRGDWVIVAIPYPRGTTFSLNYDIWGGNPTPMQQVFNFDQLDFNNYFIDPSTSHLILKLENINTYPKIYTEFYGYYDYVIDGKTINVVANCPNNRCHGNPTPPGERAIVYETKYSGTLNPCGGVNSNSRGRVFAIYNTRKSQLTVIIYHDIKFVNVREVAMYDGNTKIVIDLPKTSPIRGIVSFSSSQFNSLNSGSINFKVLTNSNPNGELCSSVQRTVLDYNDDDTLITEEGN